MPKHILKNRSIGFYLGFVLILAMTTAGSAIAAFADPPPTNTTAQVIVAPGTLTESSPANVTAGGVTLNGTTQQTTTYTLAISVTDARGSGAGWNLTITSTTFSAGFNGGPPRLGTKASSITGVTAPCGLGDTCTGNTTGYPVPVPAGTVAPAANKFFSTPGNTGMGSFTITPTVQIAIPANAFSGTYTSTVTVAAVSGP